MSTGGFCESPEHISGRASSEMAAYTNGFLHPPIQRVWHRQSLDRVLDDDSTPRRDSRGNFYVKNENGQNEGVPWGDQDVHSPLRVDVRAVQNAIAMAELSSVMQKVDELEAELGQDETID